MLTLDLGRSADGIEKVPGVKAAKVTRVWPHTAHVEVTEFQAWGYWQAGPQRLVIDEDGRVQEVRVLRSAHKLLDPAAIDAVRQWRYEPLKLNGINVRFVLTVTLAFRLQEAKAPVAAQS